MEQDYKPLLRYLRRHALIAGVVYPLGWLLFVYGFGDAYKETALMMLALFSVAIAIDGVFWLVGWLWAHR